MKRMIRTTFLSLIILSAGTALLGCQSARKVTGTQFATFAAAPPAVVEAAKATLNDLGFDSVAANATELDGSLHAKTAQGKDVHITVTKEGENVSKVSVKVGTLGGKDVGGEIIAKLKERLE